MAGPGGAYGRIETPSGQPVPGQLPPPAMTMTKPGTVTGIQVILWIFVAISAAADVASAISLVEYFSVWGIVGLGFAVYSTIQSLITPIHIARGKRWAWIWQLIGTILGLLLALASLVFGVIYIDEAPISLVIGIALTGLYGTLFGLLLSKSARQWILMHRIQRGEVQMSGMQGMQGMQGMGGPAMGGPGMGAPSEPERPASRPGLATFAVIAIWLFAALTAYGIYVPVASIMEAAEWTGRSFFEVLTSGRVEVYGWGGILLMPVLLICAVITAPLLTKGRTGARIFAVIWSIAAMPLTATLLWFTNDEYQSFRRVWLDMAGTPSDFGGIGAANTEWIILIASQALLVILSLLIFVLMLLPGVKRWTPSKPKTPLIMMVPMGQMQGAPQQAPPPGGYAPQGPAPQGYAPQGQPPQSYGQQQSQYPPQY